MAITAAELLVKVGYDDKELEQGTHRSSNTVKTLGVGLASLGGAAAAGLGVIGVMGIKAAGDFEQTQIAFEGLLGSSEKANAFLGQMRDFAAKTPFELPGLLTASKMLLATGTAAEDVIPTMTTLGNTASALGVGSQGIESVVRALGQMKGKGKVSAEEINQIGEAMPGFSAWGAIAEGAGITVAEAMDRASKGTLAAADSIPLIIAGMEKFPGAAGAMDRQSKSLNGVISTLKDSFQNALIDGILPFVPKIAELGNTIAPLIPVLIGFAVGAIKSVGGAIMTLAPIVTALTSAFQFLGDHMNIVLPILIGIGVAIGVVGTAILVGMIPALVVWLGTQILLAAAVIATYAPIVALGIAIAALVAGVIYAYNNFEIFRDVVTTVINVVQAVITTFVNVISGLWDQFGGTILTVVRTYFGLMSAYIQMIFGVIMGLWHTFSSLFRGDWAGVWNGLKETFSAAWNGITQMFWIAVSGLWNIAASVVPGVIALFRSIPGSLWGIWGGMFDGIVWAFKTAINTVIGGWNSLSFGIPGFSVGPLKYGGINIRTPQIPYLATGGIVTSSGIAMIHRGEEVVPADVVRGKSNLESTANVTNNITINMPPGSDGNSVVDSLRQYMKLNGPLPIKVAG